MALKELLNLKAETHTIGGVTTLHQYAGLQVTEPEIKAYQRGDHSLPADSALPGLGRLALLEPLRLAGEGALEIDAGLAATLSQFPGNMDADARLRLQETIDPAPLREYIGRVMDSNPGDGAAYLRLDNIRLGSLIGDRLCQELTRRGEDEAAIARVRPVVFVNAAPADELTCHRALQSRNQSGFVYRTSGQELVYIGNVQNYLMDTLDLVIRRGQVSNEPTTSKDVLSAGLMGSLGDATKRLRLLCQDGFIQSVGRVTTAAGGRPMSQYRFFHPAGGLAYSLYQPPRAAPRDDGLQTRQDKAKIEALTR